VTEHGASIAMSTSTDESIEGTSFEGRPGEIQHAHPTDLQYVKIALLLGLITAAEVTTYFWEDASTAALVVILFPMMIAKFAIVCGYFMHLKYDHPIFKRVFVAGLVLAVIVYLTAMVTLEFFSDDFFRFLPLID
jgi:cytochrome c oxidase subunit 4